MTNRAENLQAGGAGNAQHTPFRGADHVAPGEGVIWQGDNLSLLESLNDESIQVAYLDPPFNTGRKQGLARQRMSQSETGSHVGFGGRRYAFERAALRQYDDAFDDYWGFLAPRLEQIYRLLDDTGTLYLHLDYREAHYAKVLLDALFGRECFLNEIIWAYDYGGRSKTRWPAKHDTILVYVKNPRTYWFDSSTVDREPYMAPGLVTAEKAERGKLPTDVWWHTIVPTNGAERTGYPTQKPVGIVRRALAASSREGDWVLDAFGGSGTTGAAAIELGRRFVLMDQSDDAMTIMHDRLGAAVRDIPAN